MVSNLWVNFPRSLYKFTILVAQELAMKDYQLLSSLRFLIYIELFITKIWCHIYLHKQCNITILPMRYFTMKICQAIKYVIAREKINHAQINTLQITTQMTMTFTSCQLEVQNANDF